MQFRIAKAGEPYVLVCGTQIGQGKTNQVRVQYISHDDEVGHGEFQSVESEAMGVDTSDVNKAKLMQGCSIM